MGEAILHYENYGIYSTLAKDGYQEIETKRITSNNINNHIVWIMNIIRDAIETEEITNMKLKVIFDNGYYVFLYLSDYIFNLIWWSMIVNIGKKIEPKHIYFPQNQNNDYNKRYIDTWFIDENYGYIDKVILNNVINDAIAYYRYIDEFGMYFANTISLMDDIRLMRQEPRAYEIMHSNLENVPLEDHTNTAMSLTYELINIIKNHPEHWASVMFRTDEGINKKQYRENCVNTSLKPNGEGSIYPIPINSNLMYQGALKNLAYAIIDYSGGRLAQIINASNVGKSGSFARILKLNCADAFLNPNPHYVCNTRNFAAITVKDDKILNAIDGMTFRFNPRGVDKVVDAKNCKELIGQTIHLRSPITCASFANGRGICAACYGRLYYNNYDINPGIMASEVFSSQLTQRMLSAKHLLEAKVIKLDIPELFYKLFKIDFNEFSVNTELENIDQYQLQFNIDQDIFCDEEYDNIEFNEYVNYVTIIQNGNISTIDLPIPLYLTDEFYNMIKRYKNEDDISVISLVDIANAENLSSLFLLDLNNDELSAVLNKLQKIIDNAKITSSYTKDEILQDFIETSINSTIRINGVHLATILAEQFRDKDNILSKPHWEYTNADYQILALKSSLMNSPSVIKRLAYNYTDRILTNPDSYEANLPSCLDLNYILSPQKYLDPKYTTDKHNDNLLYDKNGFRNIIGIIEK